MLDIFEINVGTPERDGLDTLSGGTVKTFVKGHKGWSCKERGLVEDQNTGHKKKKKDILDLVNLALTSLGNTWCSFYTRVH